MPLSMDFSVSFLLFVDAFRGCLISVFQFATRGVSLLALLVWRYVWSLSFFFLWGPLSLLVLSVFPICVCRLVNFRLVVDGSSSFFFYPPSSHELALFVRTLVQRETVFLAREAR